MSETSNRRPPGRAIAPLVGIAAGGFASQLIALPIIEKAICVGIVSATAAAMALSACRPSRIQS
jgi:hypothetical protein